MKSNVKLPSFQKSITLDANEYTIVQTALTFALVSVPTLTENEIKTIANIMSKLASDNHPQNN
jgi:hypothetical protein